MRKLKVVTSLFLAAALVLTASSCGNNSAPAVQDSRIKVITVNFPPYDFVRQITGGEVIPEMLLKGGQDAHSFEPTAKDIIKINDADLFICTGGESDAWVDTITDSLDGNVKILRMTDFVDLLEEDDEDMEEDDEDHGHEHHGDEIEYDEHVWTSPLNAMKISDGITDALCGADPENAEKYRSGLESYKRELSALSDDFAAAAGKLGKPLIFGDRFPFAYLARDYGIEYYAAFPGCSTDMEPSAARMTALIEKAKEYSVDVIYYIEFSTEKVASAIAEAVGAQTRLMHSCHTLSDSDLAAGETYISIMRRNIASIS